jgi:LmbE family N-acetylglucosaminyl deacetylase
VLPLPVRPADAGTPLRVLALGAHADDIEIGCGGTLLRLAEEMHGAIEVCWAVVTADEAREAEAHHGAKAFLDGAASVDVVVGRLRESYLPYEGTAAKDFVHGLAARIQPDVVFTHARHDLHQDHRLISELVGNAFRNHLVLEFEIPKFDGDLTTPNVYVPLTAEQVDRKVELLHACFPSQATKYWFDRELFVGLARIRGVEARSDTGFAEGFHCRKLVLG